MPFETVILNGKMKVYSIIAPLKVIVFKKEKEKKKKMKNTVLSRWANIILYLLNIKDRTER